MARRKRAGNGIAITGLRTRRGRPSAFAPGIPGASARPDMARRNGERRWGAWFKAMWRPKLSKVKGQGSKVEKVKGQWTR